MTCMVYRLMSLFVAGRCKFNSNQFIETLQISANEVCANFQKKVSQEEELHRSNHSLCLLVSQVLSLLIPKKIHMQNVFSVAKDPVNLGR